ncbi:Uncharacterized protein dnm_002850 [Desulfonema magnum]|uniref:Uncharacterized protein n=1 Tax=Desulfonema magnum TaxID=45655 RepID=A0A975BF86_9BACT|nr:Uncharacterized protein dnm_002850 [Desulfonema magnum]
MLPRADKNLTDSIAPIATLFLFRMFLWFKNHGVIKYRDKQDQFF